MEYRISVVLPVDNEAFSVGRCLNSILAQEDASEIIVVDAGEQQLATRYVERECADQERIKVVGADSHVSLWTLLRMGVGKATGDYIMIASVSEWYSSGCFSTLRNFVESTDIDCVQMLKVERIRNIAVRSRYDLSGSLNEKIDGEEYLEIIGLRGEERIVTGNVTDKLYRRDMLLESLRIDFEGKWGVEEILNMHYFRIARSIMFADFAAVNKAWAPPVEIYGYTDLRDLKKVYGIRLLTTGDKEGLAQELHETLVEYVSKFIFQLGWTREALEFYMTKEFADGFWHKAGMDLTASELIDEATRKHKRGSVVNIIKRLMR